MQHGVGHPLSQPVACSGQQPDDADAPAVSARQKRLANEEVESCMEPSNTSMSVCCAEG